MTAPENRIEIRTQGIGELPNELIEQRARELARSDGREAPHQGDFADARRELTRTEPIPVSPEESASARDLTAWDENPRDFGVRTPKVSLEDDGNVVANLVQEGVDEADHDSRVAASEEQAEKDAE